jgi:hypothetical protein
VKEKIKKNEWLEMNHISEILSILENNKIEPRLSNGDLKKKLL